MDEPFLQTVAAGLAGIWEIGQPSAFAWMEMQRLSSDELVFVFHHYMACLEGVRKGLENGSMICYDPTGPYYCDRSTYHYHCQQFGTAPLILFPHNAEIGA